MSEPIDPKLDAAVGGRALSVELFDRPTEAPKYDKPEYLLARITTARVIGRGTVSGRPTVDLVFVDEAGQKYCAMVTGGILENLAGAIRGMHQRTLEQDQRAKGQH